MPSRLMENCFVPSVANTLTSAKAMTSAQIIFVPGSTVFTLPLMLLQNLVLLPETSVIFFFCSVFTVNIKKGKKKKKRKKEKIYIIGMASTNTKFYTAEEVALHNKMDDAWVIVRGKVYDITGCLARHPKVKSIERDLGKDITSIFTTIHSKPTQESLTKRCIGVLKK